MGKAVTSKSRDPWFESSHRQKFILNIFCQLYRKDENKEKEAGNGHLKAKLSPPKTGYAFTKELIFPYKRPLIGDLCLFKMSKEEEEERRS